MPTVPGQRTDAGRHLAAYEALPDQRRGHAYEEFFTPTTARAGLRRLDRLPQPAEWLAVDLGCGPGGLLAELERRGWRPLGIDRFEPMLRRARARSAAAGLVLADAAALPLAPGVADLVVMAFVVPHLPDLDRALREACRVLRPGGRLACVTWRASGRSPFTGLALDVLRRCARLPAEALALLDDLDERAGRLPEAAAAAGLTPRSVEHVDDERRVADAGEWWRGLVAASVGLPGLLQPLSPSERRRVRDEFCAAADAFRAGDGLRVPVAVTCLIAERT